MTSVNKWHQLRNGVTKDQMMVEKFIEVLIKIRFGQIFEAIPVGIYLLKVNNRNTRTRCEIYFSSVVLLFLF